MSGLKSDFGSRLANEWKIPASHVLYDKNGKFYMPLERFPGALCDHNGYVLFPSERDYQQCPDVQIGSGLNIRVHIRGGISSLPGYRRMR
jgi:hypothetical protein